MRRSRILRRTSVALAAVTFAVVAMLGAIAWHYSDIILVPGSPGLPRQLRVLACDSSRIRLEQNRDALRPGVWALQWEGGYGRLGPIVAVHGGAVIRDFRVLEGEPPVGRWAALRGVSRSADPWTMLGLPYREVTIPGPLGNCPAWFVPGRDSIWVLYVHGRGATRAEGLRTLGVLARRGLPGVLISYRNDPAAPRSPDGFSHLGLDEWRDLEAAARWAIAHGARGLLLAGYSMGGQIVIQFLTRSDLALWVRGVVLESPVLDWDATLRLRADIMGVPAFVATLGSGMAAVRAGLAWRQLDCVTRAREVAAPILLFHGVHDSFAPETVSEAFARALPLQVTLIPVESGDHVEAWNVDPQRYADVLERWLDAYGIGTSIPPGRHAAPRKEAT